MTAMTNMTELRFSDQSDDSPYIPVIWFAALFALVTYAAHSIRAVLSPYEVHYFIDAKRVFSVAVGAFVLWLSIRAVDRIFGHSPRAQVIAVLNIAIPGAIGLLVAREAYDLAASGAFAERFALNLRWMLTWIGYFAAAVAGFLALGAHRQLQVVIAQGATHVDILQPPPRAHTSYEVADLDFDPRVIKKT